MGTYRATLNMAGLSRGDVGKFDDDSIATIRMVGDGHLVPVDAPADILERARQEALKPSSATASSVDAVRRALDERRQAAAERAAESLRSTDDLLSEPDETEATEAAEGAEDSDDESEDPAVEEVAEEAEASDEEPETGYRYKGSRKSRRED